MDLEIKIGVSYELRNGLKTSKLRRSYNGTNYIFEAEVKEPHHITDSVFCWLKSGRALLNGEGRENRHDIIKMIS